jgi:hypothetical protein
MHECIYAGAQNNESLADEECQELQFELLLKKK